MLSGSAALGRGLSYGRHGTTRTSFSMSWSLTAIHSSQRGAASTVRRIEVTPALLLNPRGLSSFAVVREVLFIK